MSWVEAQAAEQGRAAVLVTNAFGGQTLDSPLARYVRGRTHFTPRSSRPGFRGVPVLSWVPTREALDFAAGLARGSSLCVVESVAEPVGGWAAEAGATNLLTSAATPPLPPALAEQLDRLAFYGNNAYGDPFGKQMAQRVLEDLARDGLLDRDTVVGALAARHVSPRGQRQVERMVDRMTGRRR